MTTKIQPINVASFRRDVKHLAHQMELVNAMADFDGQIVLEDGEKMLEQIEETLECYIKDLRFMREELKNKLAKWRA